MVHDTHTRRIEVDYGISGFDLAWFSSLSSDRLCIFGAMRVLNLFFKFCYLLVGKTLDLVDLSLFLSAVG